MKDDSKNSSKNLEQFVTKNASKLGRKYMYKSIAKFYENNLLSLDYSAGQMYYEKNRQEIEDYLMENENEIDLF